MSARPQRRSIRDIVGWNPRARVYYSTVAIACVILMKVHL